MGKCADHTKKVLKTLWQVAGPLVIQSGINMVGHIEAASVEDPVFWTNGAKRAALTSHLKAEAKAGGSILGSVEANLASEAIVYLRKKQGLLAGDIDTGGPVDADGDGIPDAAPISA